MGSRTIRAGRKARSSLARSTCGWLGSARCVFLQAELMFLLVRNNELARAAREPTSVAALLASQRIFYPSSSLSPRSHSRPGGGFSSASLVSLSTTMSSKSNPLKEYLENPLQNSAP
jgi:hypothetical protein